MKGFLSPLVGLPVFVDDRPGQLARLTALLAKAGLNVKDLELLKVREGRGGTFLLSFDSRSSAKKAQAILPKGKIPDRRSLNAKAPIIESRLSIDCSQIYGFVLLSGAGFDSVFCFRFYFAFLTLFFRIRSLELAGGEEFDFL